LLYHPEYNAQLYNYESNEYHIVDEIDREKLKNYGYEVLTPLGWPSDGPVRASSDFFRDAPGPIKYYKTRKFEEMLFDLKEDFTKAFIQKY
jgi:hypothetical protein